MKYNRKIFRINLCQIKTKYLSFRFFPFCFVLLLILVVMDSLYYKYLGPAHLKGLNEYKVIDSSFFLFVCWILN